MYHNLITPVEIRQKAQKLWNSGRILREALTEQSLFPWGVNFRRPTATEQVEGFSQIRDWIGQLNAHSKMGDDKSGYTIEYKTVNHRQLGIQQLPRWIMFVTQDDLLRYLGKQDEWDALLQTAEHTIERFPALSAWLIKKPQVFMQQHAIWEKLLAVCEYFIAHPRPHCYVREVDIVGIDSKFIEQHIGLLAGLLDSVLPDSAIDQRITHLRQHGFERRYGLKFEPPIIRFRLLDPALYPVAGVSDMSLPLAQLATWPIACRQVFITENKTNGLSFPNMPQSMVIFGLGYGVDSLAEIPWLKHCQLFYWGDLDTHGFGILSRLRHHFPRVNALMMDKESLQLHKHLCVTEPKNARCQRELTELSEAEQTLYQQLQQSHQRLEQERLPMGYVRQRLLGLGVLKSG